MFVVLRIIRLPPATAAEREALAGRLRDAAAGLPGLAASWIAPVLSSAAINAGEIVWRAIFASEAAALALPREPVWRARIASLLQDAEVVTVGYRVTRAGGALAGSGVWRALVFRVMPHGFPEQAAALEAGLQLMPKHIPEIRSWALNPVAFSDGPKRFTHVWEQEFERLEDLTGPYMNHPLHWGYVDAWFDAEYPQYVVDPYLLQVAGEVEASIMAPPSQRGAAA